MDANRFDDLVKRAAMTPLTRVHVLRGLVASGVAALTGVTLAGEEADAKKTKKVKVCHCHGADPNVCSQGKVKIKKGTDKGKRKAKKLRKHLKNNLCDYKGKCQATNPRCPTGGGGCSSTSDCPSGRVCVDGQCVGGEGCGGDGDCDDPLICLGEICVLGNNCEDNSGCDDPLVCLLGLCLDVDDECGDDGDCDVGEFCVLGLGICADLVL